MSKPGNPGTLVPLSPTMNPELKQRWLKALRSGTYPQGQEALRRQDTFCCLGVLCDLGLPEAWQEHTYEPGTFYHPWGDASYELLEESYRVTIGLDEALQQRLANMNDQGKSFIEIALVIEAEA